MDEIRDLELRVRREILTETDEDRLTQLHWALWHTKQALKAESRSGLLFHQTRAEKCYAWAHEP